MCLDKNVSKDFNYNTNPEGVYNPKDDVMARQFRDLIDHARNSVNLDAFTKKLDIAPQVANTETLEPIKLDSQKSIPGTVPFFGQPNVASASQISVPGIGQYGFGNQPDDAPVYDPRTSDKAFKPTGSFYDYVSGLSDVEANDYSTKFIQGLRGSPGNMDVLDEFGVRDLVGQSRVVRNRGGANIGSNQSTVAKPATVAEAVVGGVAGQGGGGSPQKIYRSAINNNAVRNVA